MTYDLIAALAGGDTLLGIQLVPSGDGVILTPEAPARRGASSTTEAQLSVRSLVPCSEHCCGPAHSTSGFVLDGLQSTEHRRLRCKTPPEQAVCLVEAAMLSYAYWR